jgi:hypothetical protein
MKEARIREYTVEMIGRQIEREEVLVQDFTARVGPCHLTKIGGALETHRLMAQGPQGGQVPAGATAKIKNPMGPTIAERTQQGRNVLAHVMVTGSFPERLCFVIIAVDRGTGQLAHWVVRHHQSPWLAMLDHGS